MILTPTGQEELQIAIAEEMGWKWHYCECCKSSGAHYWNKGDFNYRTAVCFANLPPYTTSLDAIQAAALERFKDFTETMMFNEQLGIRTSELANLIEVSKWTWQLTALDWCIAFARTAKIWRYKV